MRGSQKHQVMQIFVVFLVDGMIKEYTGINGRVHPGSHLELAADKQSYLT